MDIRAVLAILVCSLLLLAALLAVVVVMLRKDRHKQVAIQQSSDFLLQVAYEDDITGLPTLTKFTMDIAPLLSCALPGEYSIMMLDIDNFKYVNDVVGYKTANRILRCLAKYLQEELPPKSILSRVNADNFILFCKTGGLDDIGRVIQGFRVQSYFGEAQQLLGQSYSLSFSMGIYIITDTDKELALMMDFASIAKKAGKDIYGSTSFLYSEAMDLDMQLKNKITVIMEKALADNEFVPYLQPQYSLSSGQLVGAEVLARWHSSVIGAVFPTEFIPLFEKNGFICKLDMFMLERTCALIRGWLDGGLLDIPRISVNASKLTVTSFNYLDSVSQILQKYEIPAEMIEIELTESVLGDSPQEVLSIMAGLKALGFFISLDDFGKGYSSLNLLKDIPADVLKLDRGFITDTMNNERGQNIMSSVIGMSKKLRLETVAEGIETLEQADSLRDMGCDVAQGFYFARPMPSEMFEQTLWSNQCRNADAGV